MISMDRYYITNGVRSILHYGHPYETDAYPDAPVNSIVYSRGLAGVIVAEGEINTKFVSYDAVVKLDYNVDGANVGRRLYLYPNDEQFSIIPYDPNDLTAYCAAIRLPDRLCSDPHMVVKFIELGCNTDGSQQLSDDSRHREIVETTMQSAMVSYTPKDMNNKEPKQTQTGWDYVGRQCPRCGSQLVYRLNKKTNQKFIGCSSFMSQNCKYSEIIESPTKGPRIVDDDLPF